MVPVPSPTAPQQRLDGIWSSSMTMFSLCATPEVSARVIYPTLDDPEVPVASFEPSRLVLYMLETLRRPRVFALRTLPGAAPKGAILPGVSRAVDLLFATRTRSAAARVRNMLLYFQRRQIEPSKLSEDFWLRLGVLLNGRLRSGPHLPSLLATEDAT
jgi:hypothetical protein